MSIPGVYGGMADKFPLGALMEKGLTIKTGQTHVQKYVKKLLDVVLDGKIDTTFLISHRLPLEQAAEDISLQGAAERCDESCAQARADASLTDGDHRHPSPQKRGTFFSRATQFLRPAIGTSASRPDLTLL